MHIGCESTAYSVGTVHGGKGHLYTPGVRPALLATPRRFTGDHPTRPVDDVQLVTPARLTPEHGHFSNTPRGYYGDPVRVAILSEL